MCDVVQLGQIRRVNVGVVEVLGADGSLVREDTANELVERLEVAEAALDHREEVLAGARLVAPGGARPELREERLGLGVAGEVGDGDPLARAADAEPYEELDDAPVWQGGRWV